MKLANLLAGSRRSGQIALAATLFLAAAMAQSAELELVVTVPAQGGIQPEWIEAIRGLDSRPGEIVLAVRNQGAGCGGGTPVSIGKAILDPATGEPQAMVFKQQLSAIQTAQGTLFEASDGTLLTGGGWCGYKPPYYSTDGGESWQTADSGPVHPPNSTYSLAELNGQVYASTGYNPYPGQVYRWLGNGNWQLVLDLGTVRNLVATLLVHDGLLFVGSNPYGFSTGACEGTVPVYVSSDGDSYTATTGIPPCHSVTNLMAVGDDVVAITNQSTDRRLYRWLAGSLAWEEVTDLGWFFGANRQTAAHGGSIYALGSAPETDPRVVYQSDDLGLSWQAVATIPVAADGSALSVYDRFLYIGTHKDAGNEAYLYRMLLSAPGLSIASETPAAENETVDVDVDFSAAGASIAAATFSIDYDETCLFFDDTDCDADGIPDDLAVQVPGFTVTAFHDLDDPDGEIDVLIADLAPPFTTLPDGVLMSVTFTATCEPEIGSHVDAPVLFSGDPAATFSDDLAQDVGGLTTGGSVRIHPGPRGDCNAGGELGAADLLASTLEIFDGDGDFWGDVPGGTYPGSPVGCDSNADGDVTAGDVSCTILRIFGGSCGAARGWSPMATFRGPVLAIDGMPRLEPGSTIRVPVRLSSLGQALSSVAFSLDLDSSRLSFDATDADRDGVPDAVRFPAGKPLLAQVLFDLRDREGELDVALAAEPGTAFADGVLLDLEFEIRSSGRLGKSLGFSEAPAASFGDLIGRGVPGRGIVAWPIHDLPPAPSPRPF